MTIVELIEAARAQGCSDIHLSMGLPPVFRRLGRLERSAYALTEPEIEGLIRGLLSADQAARLEHGEDLDFAFAVEGRRQRVNVYREQGRLCAAIRLLNDRIPTLEELDLPPVLRQMTTEPRGLILVTGPTGSGKSTTLAAMIDAINHSRSCHILTVEDPIEYLYTDADSMIHQREVGRDVASFADALRSAMREDPDVILVGEMRDYETIRAAVTAAETGHLVLSTLHTTGAANTIDRIVDVFPPHDQAQIRTQLAGVLKGVVTQQLVPLASGEGRVAAVEILTGTEAVLNLIRENKTHQLHSIMQTGTKDGMQTLDAALAALVRARTITREAAAEKATDRHELERYLTGFRSQSRPLDGQVW